MAVEEPILACPHCGGSLAELVNELACMSCGRRFRVLSGIPRFVTAPEEPKEFDLRWQTAVEGAEEVYNPVLRRNVAWRTRNPAWVEAFRTQFPIPETWFRGKRVLDLGCGIGRYSWVMALWGATVHAVDPSPFAVELVRQELGNLPNVRIYQAELPALPFRPASFDLVLCIGVLHHTPNTLASLERAAKLVREGGYLATYLYEKHNLVREITTSILRKIIRPNPATRQMDLYRRHLLLGTPNTPSSRFRRSFLKHVISLCETVGEARDTYAPRFNHTHAASEVLLWYQRLGFPDARVTYPPKDATRKFRAFALFPGEYGGSFFVLGQKQGAA